MDDGRSGGDNPGERKVLYLMERKAKAKAPKQAKEKKTETLAVKMTPSEKDRIQALADAEEKTMSTFAREVIRKLAQGWTLVPPSS